MFGNEVTCNVLLFSTCVILVSQVFVSITHVYKPFEHIKVSENKAVEFCIIVWGPLTEAVHVLVETTDSALALGKRHRRT